MWSQPLIEGHSESQVAPGGLDHRGADGTGESRPPSHYQDVGMPLDCLPGEEGDEKCDSAQI